jgi:Icc-related predicted phosphoesterase
MKKYEYTHFINENVAPKGATKIVVKDKDGNVVATAPLGKLKPPSPENKLYSFGVFSDVHVNTTDSSNRFKYAVKYLADTERVDFICIAGDLTNSGAVSDIKEYIGLTQIAKSQCSRQIEIHDTTGNHDVQTKAATKSYLQEYADGIEPYTTRELYYSFTHGDDLFVMFGMSGWPGKTGTLYSDESYTWLEETLEANKDKRCFLFSHPPYFTYDSASGLVCDSGSGAIVGYPPPTGTYIQWYSTSAPRFKNALNSHPNLFWFHGHSHVEFCYQEVAPYVNYCRENFESNSLPGVHSIHVPSLAVGREPKPDWSGWRAPTPNRGGEGYIVDRYEKYVVLRGFNFVEKQAVPIATYCIKT